MSKIVERIELVIPVSFLLDLEHLGDATVLTGVTMVDSSGEEYYDIPDYLLEEVEHHFQENLDEILSQDRGEPGEEFDLASGEYDEVLWLGDGEEEL